MPSGIYKQVSVHETIVAKIDALMSRMEGIPTAPHFTSRADFVKYAINEKLNELNQIYFNFHNERSTHVPVEVSPQKEE